MPFTYKYERKISVNVLVPGIHDGVALLLLDSAALLFVFGHVLGLALLLLDCVALLFVYSVALLFVNC